MSKFKQIEDFNIEFHRWYNMEPPPFLGYPGQNPTSLFSSVDCKMSLENIYHVREKFNYETGIAEHWNHKLVKAKKELVDLNGKANEVLYQGKSKMDEESNKGFEDIHQVAKRNESH
ncbi:ion channel POLLUX-like 2 [Pyrus ussuriensis x Pyrus communis]|uniref:Ion channel POLLUX-like 2 n=1 Tax=Pyrus ussuriensis x Pyrus communis TaxID=2448454 RepID=A0A5N5HKM0_9ROSA|nr:ion channel POLLUX-like 2 [Pyrus ussuriensis x Pyrus communis]